MIILDFGSGNTCRNREDTAEEMVKALAKVDPHRRAIIKWQLWDAGTEPQCCRLNWEVFQHAFDYAMTLGYRTTASVFDKPSLDYLLTFDVPFVKIANRPYLRELSRYVPRGMPIVYSYAPDEIGSTERVHSNTNGLLCVSKYPADLQDYISPCEEQHYTPFGISDHTIGLDLWRRYHPSTYEKHFKLAMSTGPDSGPWAATLDELSEVLA